MFVVPYIGTWIETNKTYSAHITVKVVPYIGTWIETYGFRQEPKILFVVPYIGTWIETEFEDKIAEAGQGRTLYRYVD